MLDWVMAVVDHFRDCGIRRNHKGVWWFRCPAHEDGTPSARLSLGQSRPDTLMLKCYAGCDTNKVLEKVGLRMSDLFADKWTGGDRVFHHRRVIERVYPYTDEEGVILYEKVRYNPKGFAQRRTTMKEDGTLGYLWDLDGVRRVPYLLPELVSERNKGRTVLFLEGEKDVETARRLGFLATCLTEGAGSKWNEEYGQYFRGRRVLVIPDSDVTGLEYGALVVGNLLVAGAESVGHLRLPAKDLTEWAEAGGTGSVLRQMAGDCRWFH